MYALKECIQIVQIEHAKYVILLVSNVLMVTTKVVMNVRQDSIYRIKTPVCLTVSIHYLQMNKKKDVYWFVMKAVRLVLVQKQMSVSHVKTIYTIMTGNVMI